MNDFDQPPKMAAADPDFLLLVETNWLQLSAAAGATSARAHTRLQEQSKAFWNELITLRLVPPAGGTRYTRPILLLYSELYDRTSSVQFLTPVMNVLRF
jgi:hypothetical protein